MKWVLCQLKHTGNPRCPKTGRRMKGGRWGLYIAISVYGQSPLVCPALYCFDSLLTVASKCSRPSQTRLRRNAATGNYATINWATLQALQGERVGGAEERERGSSSSSCIERERAKPPLAVTPSSVPRELLYWLSCATISCKENWNHRRVASGRAFRWFIWLWLWLWVLDFIYCWAASIPAGLMSDCEVISSSISRQLH